MTGVSARVTDVELFSTETVPADFPVDSTQLFAVRLFLGGDAPKPGTWVLFKDSPHLSQPATFTAARYPDLPPIVDVRPQLYAIVLGPVNTDAMIE